MKETTGELNMTIIVVIAVAILVAFFYFVIWPSLDENFEANSKCSRAICLLPDECKGKKKNDNACNEVLEGLVECKVPGSETKIYCPWKG